MQMQSGKSFTIRQATVFINFYVPDSRNSSRRTGKCNIFPMKTLHKIIKSQQKYGRTTGGQYLRNLFMKMFRSTFFHVHERDESTLDNKVKRCKRSLVNAAAHTHMSKSRCDDDEANFNFPSRQTRKFSFPECYLSMTMRRTLSDKSHISQQYHPVGRDVIQFHFFLLFSSFNLQFHAILFALSASSTFFLYIKKVCEQATSNRRFGCFRKARHLSLRLFVESKMLL